MNNYYTRLINREHPLPEDYIPPHLIDIGLPFEAVPGDPKRLLEEKAAYAALELISRSRREGLNLCGISGYRSYARQKNYTPEILMWHPRHQRTPKRTGSGCILPGNPYGAHGRIRRD